MNKVYRIIWSKTKNCWIVVSEIAKRHGKAAARKGGTAVLGGLVTASLLAGMSVCSPVWAAVDIQAVNYEKDAQGQPFLPTIVVEYQNQTTGQIYRSYAYGLGSTTWGVRSQAGQPNAVPGIYTPNGCYATAWGADTKALADEATAFGIYTTASGMHSTAFGANTTATGGESTAFGSDTVASGTRSTATGWGTQALGNQATSFGRDTIAAGDNSLVGGYRTTINGSGSFAFGYDNTILYGNRSAAWGNNSRVEGRSKDDPIADATAFGNGSKAYATNSLAALGGTVGSAAQGSAAIGDGATVSQAGTVALGAGSNASVGAGIKGYNPLGAATATGNAWTSTNAAIAVGNGSSLTRQIVGVAAGTNPTDAVNVAQLKALAEGTALKTSGNTGTGSVNLATQTFAVKGGDSNITTVASGQQVTINLSKNLTGLTSVQVGPVTINNNGIDAGSKKITNVAPGTSGMDAVNLNQLNTGLNSIHFTVANGSTGSGTSSGSSSNVYSGNTVTFRAGDNMALVQSGNTLTYSAVDKTTSHKFSLSDQNGNNKATANIDGAVQVIGADGITTQVVNNKLQISLSNPSNGLTFDGDAGTAATVPLDNKVTIKGGITTASQLSDNNIGVVSAQNGKNGVLTVKLAKNINLGSDGSVKTGNTTINNTGLTISGGPSITNSGIDMGSKKITNVAPGTSGTDAVNLNQLKAAKAEVKAGTNVDVVETKDTTDGHSIYTVNADGTSVSAGSTAVKVTKGSKGSNNVTDYAVDLSDATKSTLDKVENEGLTFTGNSGSSGVIKLGEELGIVGDNNITTAGSRGQIQVKLNKNIDLGSNGSVKMGNTTVNNNGLTITGGPSVTTNGIDVGGKKITSVAAGTANTDAVNVSQLKAAKTEVKSDGKTVNVTQSTGSNGQTIYNLEVDKGATTFGLKDSNGDEVTRATGSTIAVVGADDNITTEVTGRGDNAKLTVKLADDLSVSSVTVDDSVTIGDTVIEEGDKVKNIYGDKINRITVGGETVATLSDGLFFGANSGTTAANPLNSEVDIVGSVAKRGHDYSAENLTTEVSQAKDGTTTITVKMDEKPTFTTVNTTEIHLGDTYITEKDGDVYIDDSKVITGTEQLLHVQGDEGKAKQIDRTYDEILHVEGGATGTLTEGNIGVTSDGRDTLTVKLAQNIDLGKAGSVTMGNTTVNNTGLTINNGPSITNTGIDAGGKKITNVAEGKDGTDAVNVDQLKSGLEEIHFTIDNGSTGTGKSKGSSSDVYSGDTVTFQAGDNMVLEQNGNTLTYSADLSSVIDPTKGGGFGLTPDDTSKSVKQELGKTIGVIGDTTYTIDGTKLKDGNIVTGVSKDKDGNEAIKVELAKDITVNNITTKTIKLGDTYITEQGGDVYIDDNKIMTGTDQLLHVQGDEGKAKQIDRTYDEILHVEGGADKDTLTDGNIGVTSDGTDTLTIKLSKDIDLTKDGSVTMGDTVVNNDGLTITGGPVVTKDKVDVAGNQITSLASGLTDGNGRPVELKDAVGTNAVNVDDLRNSLNNATDELTAKGLNFTADNYMETHSETKTNVPLGETLAVKGDANIITEVDTTKADQTVTITLNKNLTGIDGIGLNGVDGKDGEPGITTIKVEKGQPGVDGKDGITRIVYTDPDGDKQEVATLNDGLKFRGDDGVTATRKLNKIMDFAGGADKATLTEGNIGVNYDTASGKMMVQLSKDIDLTKDGSVTVGDTVVNNDGLTINNGPTVTKDKVDVAGNQINNLASGLTDADGNPVDLKDATGDTLTNAVNVGDLKDAITGSEEKGLNFAANSNYNNEPVHKDLGETLTIKGSGTKANTEYTSKNIKTRTDAEGNVIIMMDKNLTGISSIGLNGVDGKDGKDGITTIKVEKGEPGVDGKDGITRIVYTDPDGEKQEVATLNDGLKFRGDDGVMATRKLNKVLDFEGGADKETLTEGNIGVNYDKATAKMKVQLSKDIDLTEDGSVNIGDTLLNNDGLTINNGPTVTKDKVDVAGNQINNLASGLTDADGNPAALDDAVGTNAVNVDDLRNSLSDSEKDLINKGFGLRDDEGNRIQQKLGYTLGIIGDSVYTTTTTTVHGESTTTTEVEPGNILTRVAKDKDGKSAIQVYLNKDLKGFDSIGMNGVDGKDGEPGITTIKVEKGEPGVDGKDGITRIVYTDPDGDKQEVATLNDGLKFRGDDGVMATRKLNKVLDFEGGADKDSLTEGNIGVNYDKDTAKMKVQLSKDIDLTEDGSVTIGDTLLNNDGLAITGGPTVTKDKVDMAGNQITSVGSGLIDADGNPVDLKDATGDMLNNAVNVGDLQKAAGDITSAGLDFVGDDGTVVHRDLGTTLGIKGEVEDVSTLTTGNIGVVGDAETGTMTVKLNQDLKDMNSATFTQKDEDGNPTGGTTVINGDGVTITGPAGEEGEPGKTVSLTGDGLDNGGNKIVNVAAGEDDTDAVNVSQLKEVEQLASEHTTMTVNGGDYESGSQEGDLVLVESKNATGGIHYDVSLSDLIEIGGPGKDGQPGKDGHIGVNGKDGKSGVGIDGKNGISVRGADGKDGVTIYAKDGEDGTEGHIGLNGKDGASADITVVKGDPGVNGKDGETMDRIQYEDGEGNPHQVATLDDGTKYKGDSGDQLAVPLNKVVNVKGGATGELTDGNIGVVGSAKDNTLNIKLAKDIKGLDSLEVKKINATTVNADEFHAGDVSVTKEGIDAGSKKIVNVAPGEVSATSRDAVNGSQLYQAQKQIYNNIENLDDRVKKVGAGAAALAGLHPLDFDPDAKWDVTAGYGHYRGKNAAAVGAFYRPDENTMLSVASTVGNGDNMVSAGVTLKIDGKSRVNNSRTAMGKQIIEMRKELEDLRALIADQAAGRQLDLSKLQLFPDTPENHWAYDYVATLAGNGLLEGYPDGNFKGDRELTRYEVAAILYRAMTNGAQLTERALKEFAPELNRIRVDTISHHSDGTPSIQRVRVVKGRG